MSLRDKLKIDAATTNEVAQKRFDTFGVVANPFPSAGEPSGHPHLEGSVDEEIVRRIKEFHEDSQSQVLLVEGTQGVGKTNLLAHYENELREAFSDEPGFYIIRYYMDPEPSFDGILRRLFQELGSEHLVKMAKGLNARGTSEREEITRAIRSHELRKALLSLAMASEQGDSVLLSHAEMLLEWLVGMRVFNRHKDSLGVQFRLDTVESRTQILRDIVFCSAELKLLKGIFLLLDELEKQDYSVSKTVLLRYLSAIRAIIDALPGYLFLMIALTPEARRRYFEMLPAFQGRLQNVIRLKPLTDEKTALGLFSFYVDAARKQAMETLSAKNRNAHDLLTASEVKSLFQKHVVRAKERGSEGVTHRDFLNILHEAAAERLHAL